MRNFRLFSFGMLTIPSSLPAKRIVSLFLSLLFFTLFYLYLRFYVDLRFIYSCGGLVTNFPVFAKSWAFLRQHISCPGGIVQYVSAFLSQLFYIGWAGPLVVTAQAWAMSVCAGYILKNVNLPRLRFLRFVPVLILLITYTRYTYHFYAATAFLTALLFMCLYLRIALVPTRGYVRVGVLAFMSIALYYIAGGAYLLFALLCALYDLFFRRKLALGVSSLLLAVIVPYVVGVQLFGGSILNAFSDSLPFSWKMLGGASRWELAVLYVLYLFLPATMVARAFYRKTLASRIRTRFRSRLLKTKRGAGSPILKSLVGSFVLTAFAFVAIVLARDGQKRTVFAVHYYACQRMWPEVLQAARRYPGDPFVMNAVNRALYHTGRLGYDMFCWPQHPDALLPTGDDRVLACWHKFDTQIDLGLMNMAERNLTECTQLYGEQPTIIERLALINMVKANYGSARIYLGALRQTLFHSAWANHYLNLLQSDPNLSTDERIQYLRSVYPEKDYVTIRYSREKVLRDLIEKNSKNRMAFEYLTAWYMLTKQLEKCVRNIEHVDDFDYSELPRLYEEAALIYAYGTGKPIQWADHQPSREARLRIETFSRIFNGHRRNKAEAFSDLAQDYGDSYFFYHIYGISGVSK
jgi:hypothetical protein